ncbi:ribose utilization transcriptional repressor RbsR [Ligilactobacillus acidipiscis]|uniref:ribose utilization transcriptional repressor RbsR n=1 Tax=Ligilactobacillus acidipiscis TaxID=89059 RepID=UPI0023F68658|nr:substrate-binding domain-containing protein [Ligilactobacillus acidipiscis]WEV56751.1 substrate-binding domain-containing protein [Ligilactobacillus acidipiscis]
MNKKKITIKDVAKKAGLSITSVSQILNGNTQRFSEKAIKKVYAAQKELNYVPDFFAQRMVTKKSHLIGVLVPDISNPFFAQLFLGIQDILNKQGYVALLYNMGGDEKQESHYVEDLIRRGVDGLIIASSAFSDQSIYQALQRESLPMIVMDQKTETDMVDAVQADNYDGGKQAALYLQELGHKKTAVVLPENPTVNVRKRYEGFASVYGDELLVVNGELSTSGGQGAVKKIINSDITAIFAINDLIAFGLYMGLKEAGKKIPNDYSVVGFDDISPCRYVTPPLTTIAQPTFELGQEAAKMLMGRLNSPQKEPEEKMLPVKLVQRFSVMPLK